MKRSQLRRGKPLERGGRLRQVSAKRAKLNRERAVFVERVLAMRPRCEVCPLVNPPTVRPAVDVHEIVTRARGGSIVDAANVATTCRQCHDWVHANPAKATEFGLLASRR